MKKISILICGLWLNAALAQKPETVQSFAREKHETSWYETQHKLWKAEIDKNKSNSEAWYNYYRATRALAFYAPYLETDEKKIEAMREKYVPMSAQVIEDAYAAVPESYEANLMKYQSNMDKGVEYLLKAYSIDPTDVRAFDALMVYYESSQNAAEFEKMAVKMYQYNVLPASIINWGYNVLSELDDKAVLLTGGDNDTYACWIVQQVKNVRKDVQVINTSLMQQDEYRNKLFKKMGIPPLNISLEKAKDQEELNKLFFQIVDHLKKSGRPLYISTTTVGVFEPVMGEELFLTGLAYKYSKESFDNTAVIRRNYEKKYLLDHIQQQFSFNMGDNIADEFNSMYLPSMLKLYKSYKQSEESEKMKNLETLILMIAGKSRQKDEVVKAMKE